MTAVLMALIFALMSVIIASPAAVAEDGTHTVTFRVMTEKYEGVAYAYKPIKTITVADGECVPASELPDKSEVPSVPYNIHYEYTQKEEIVDGVSNPFAGWGIDADTAVTKDLVVDALYNMNAKIYTITYHDWDGTVLVQGADENFGMPAKHAPTGLTRPADYTYVYEFENEWETAYARTNKTGEVFKKDFINFTEDCPTAIDVYAVYQQRLVRYPVTVYVTDADNEPVEGAVIQIMTGDKLLAGGAKPYGTTDADGFCHLEVSYSASGYQISAVWPDDDSQGRIFEATIDDFNNTIVMQLTDNNQYHYENAERCTHICHSFLGGLYITGLNLLYRIFHVKYVCCYDMYATHGDKLAYTP